MVGGKEVEGGAGEEAGDGEGGVGEEEVLCWGEGGGGGGEGGEDGVE